MSGGDRTSVAAQVEGDEEVREWSRSEEEVRLTVTQWRWWMERFAQRPACIRTMHHHGAKKSRIATSVSDFGIFGKHGQKCSLRAFATLFRPPESSAFLGTVQ